MNPSRPAKARSAVGLPSRNCAVTITFAPGRSSDRSPGLKVTIGTLSGTITWIGVHDALPAELRLYDRLFTEAQPDAGGKDFKASLNPNSKKVVSGFIEPSLANAQPDDKFQFERHGYFVADRVDHAAGKPVINQIAGLKDSWSK